MAYVFRELSPNITVCPVMSARSTLSSPCGASPTLKSFAFENNVMSRNPVSKGDNLSEISTAVDRSPTGSYDGGVSGQLEALETSLSRESSKYIQQLENQLQAEKLLRKTADATIMELSRHVESLAALNARSTDSYAAHLLSMQHQIFSLEAQVAQGHRISQHLAAQVSFQEGVIIEQARQLELKEATVKEVHKCNEQLLEALVTLQAEQDARGASQAPSSGQPVFSTTLTIDRINTRETDRPRRASISFETPLAPPYVTTASSLVNRTSPHSPDPVHVYPLLQLASPPTSSRAIRGTPIRSGKAVTMPAPVWQQMVPPPATRTPATSRKPTLLATPLRRNSRSSVGK